MISHMKRRRTMSHSIIIILLVNYYSYGCSKQFQVPSLFQNREIKGNHAGNQVLAMGILRQCMRNTSFRQYAQERVRSEQQLVIDHLIGKAKPSELGEDGEIPEKYIVASNGVGKFSLNFYKGKFNINRKGIIKRIPMTNIESNLRGLDEKTIHHYLSVAKIGMSRCEDDSIMLRSHIDLKGGYLPYLLFNNLMFTIQFAGRALLTLTAAQAAENLGQIAHRGYNVVRDETARTLRPHLTEAQRKAARVVVETIEQGANGVYYAAQRSTETAAELVQYVIGNASTIAADQAVSAARNAVRHQSALRDAMPLSDTTLVDALLGRNNLVGQLVEQGTDLVRSTIVPGASTAVTLATDVVRSQFPNQSTAASNVVAGTATSWAWLFNLLEFAVTVRI